MNHDIRNSPSPTFRWGLAEPDPQVVHAGGNAWLVTAWFRTRSAVERYCDDRKINTYAIARLS